jgi:hypothetical protein
MPIDRLHVISVVQGFGRLWLLWMHLRFFRGLRAFSKCATIEYCGERFVKHISNKAVCCTSEHRYSTFQKKVISKSAKTRTATFQMNREGPTGFGQVAQYCKTIFQINYLPVCQMAQFNFHINSLPSCPLLQNNISNQLFAKLSNGRIQYFNLWETRCTSTASLR